MDSECCADEITHAEFINNLQDKCGVYKKYCSSENFILILFRIEMQQNLSRSRFDYNSPS